MDLAAENASAGHVAILAGLGNIAMLVMGGIVLFTSLVTPYT